MNRSEVRYRVTAALLQAEAPLTLGEIVADCGASRHAVLSALERLTAEGAVVEGELLRGRSGPQYFWAARWRKRAGRRKGVSEARPAPPGRPRQPDIEDELVRRFHEFIIGDYTPPKGKRGLVFFQCAVRRPFSKSPSHGSMRRAVAVAPGYDPARQCDPCPVHVVVLASRIGPVPYELEDFYPANVGGGGVKHFGQEHYARVKPILAARMAEYVTTHRRHYDHIAAFTEGRYGEVMAAARGLSGVRFAIFPQPNGPKVLKMDGSAPRTYWQSCWIQLYLEIVSWLSPAMQAQADGRLKAMKVVCR